MRFYLRSIFRIGFCAALLAQPFAARAADDYPNRPIRIIVPIAAAGTGDTLARLVGDRLSQSLKQSVVIDNRPGANGIVGVKDVATAAPDGYTLLLATTGNIAINPGLYGDKLGFDPLKDLAPITQIANTTSVLVVNPSFPAKSVKELIDYAKANPGKLDYASPGVGSTAQLDFALFAYMAGIDVKAVTYKGSTPAELATAANEVPAYIDGIIPAMGQVKGGKLRALGVTSEGRSPLMPDVPSIADAVPGYSAYTWYGMFAPANTPRPIIDKLNSAIVEILKNPQLKTQLTQQSADVIGNSPEEFAKFVGTEIPKWTDIVKRIGLKVE
jgi:tripartite-type tricarboxylate transporter receptor subunit TctC